jgi:tRNA-specific 2-thiouridylase
MTRYRQEPQACSVELDATGCTVVFDAPQRAVTPGQSVVFYDDDVCLGGAVIECSDAPYGGWEMRDA